MSLIVEKLQLMNFYNNTTDEDAMKTDCAGKPVDGAGQAVWPCPVLRETTALLFIEFQKEWLSPQGILHQRLVRDKARVRQAAARAGLVLDAARRNGWTVVHAGLDLRGDPTARLFAGGRGVLGLRAAIPAARSWTGPGADFVEPFVPRQGEFVVAGRSGASVFDHGNLQPFLRNNHVDTVLLMGFATHVCVESSLRSAHDAGYNAYVVLDACAAFSEEQDAYFAQNILHHFGAGVTAAQAAALLEGA